jgi:hypothetical protein
MTTTSTARFNGADRTFTIHREDLQRSVASYGK